MLTVKVYEVRDAHGAQRLGRLVRERMGEELAGEGLSISEGTPGVGERGSARLPTRCPVADLIEAVERPSEAGDQVVRDAVGGDASGTLDQIRELVCASP